MPGGRSSGIEEALDVGWTEAAAGAIKGGRVIDSGDAVVERLDLVTAALRVPDQPLVAIEPDSDLEGRTGAELDETGSKVAIPDMQAASKAIPMVQFERGQRKEAIAQPYLERAAATGREGVVMIGLAQEKANVFRPPSRHQRVSAGTGTSSDRWRSWKRPT